MEHYFTLKDEGIPIAIIRGGIYNGKIISITDNKDHIDKPEDIMVDLGEDFIIRNRMQSGRKLNARDLKIIAKLIKEKPHMSEEKRKKMDPIVSLAEDELNKYDGREFNIDSGTLELVPRQDSRDVLYVAGMSGAGKSTFCANYMRNFNKLYPEKDVILFSHKDEDEAFDDIENFNRIDMNDPSIIEEPIHMNELEDSLVIFDDTDILPKKIQKSIHDTRDQLLQGARSLNTYVICTAHQLSNYRDTRCILNEAHYMVVFPRACNEHQLNTFLRKYGGFTDELMARAKKLPSRWICIRNLFPKCVIHEGGVFMI